MTSLVSLNLTLFPCAAVSLAVLGYCQTSIVLFTKILQNHNKKKQSQEFLVLAVLPPHHVLRRICCRIWKHTICRKYTDTFFFGVSLFLNCNCVEMWNSGRDGIWGARRTVLEVRRRGFWWRQVVQLMLGPYNSAHSQTDWTAGRTETQWKITFDTRHYQGGVTIVSEWWTNTWENILIKFPT